MAPRTGSNHPRPRCRLARVRRQRGWSQAALAKQIRVSRQTVSSVERGRTVPSIGLALRLARALAVPVEALFRLPD